MREKTCGNCYYWKYRSDPDWNLNPEIGRFGDCWFMPPVVKGHENDRPTVHESFFCGQWKEKEAEGEDKSVKLKD